MIDTLPPARGRPSVIGASKRVTTRLEPELLEEIETRAKRYKVSVSKMIRILLRQGVSDD